MHRASPMNALTIATLRASYDGLARRMDQVVDRFYSELFRQRPELRKIFPSDMARQQEHLAAALAILFRNIESLQALEPSLMSLGAQHVGFGVLPEHYPVLRDILVEAIASVAKPAWSQQLEEAWLEALNQVCVAMLRGAAAAALSVAQSMSPPASGLGLGAPGQGAA